MIADPGQGSAARRVILAAVAALVLWAGAAAAADLRLTIDSPPDGSIARDSPGTVTLRGHLRVGEFTPPPSDVVLLIDASEDSAAPSGADLDGDGRVSPGQGLRILGGLGRVDRSRWGRGGRR